MTAVHRALLAVAIAGAGASGCRGGGSGGHAGNTGAGGSSGATGNTGAGGSGAHDGAVAFSRAELLGAFGTCAATRAREFRAKAVALDAAVAAYVATPEATSRDAARQAFKDALDAWQAMDLMQFGPTASGTVLGGKDFRDNIYAWPRVDRCAIEEAIVARSYAAANFESVLLARQRGLGAAEYLLFYEGADTACGSTSTVPAAWMALADDERAARKRAYLATDIQHVLARAVALDEAWDPAKLNFVQTLRSAGPGNAVYPTAQAAIETVGLAIFFLDRVVKDLKLTELLNNSCLAATCLESPYAGRSKLNIRGNLDGLRRVLEGCGPDHAGLGFDDLLASVGAPALADTLRAQSLAAQAALDAIEEPDLASALLADPASVTALRDAISVVTTTIKTQFYTTLNFEPATIPTDND